VVYRRALTQSPAELHLIVLDESGSMGRGQRLAAAKGYAVALLQRLARGGQSVAVLSFGGAGVRPLVWPQRSRRALAQPLRMLGAAGGTPLDAALRAAQALVQRERRQGAGAAVLWLLTDGRIAQSPPAPKGFDALHLVDFDGPRVRAGRCRDWAQAWGGQWWDGWAAVAPGSGGHHVGLA
jgi:magnesium chelatase subunit ChlD-like protein